MNDMRMWLSSVVCALGIGLVAVGLVVVTPHVVLAGGNDSDCISGCGTNCDQPPCGSTACDGGASCPDACECNEKGKSSLGTSRCECGF